jgi:hypothetical protein
VSTDTIRKTRWYWAWQDQQEESWLEEMSKEGLHLLSVALPAFYTFEQGKPIDYAYRLDFGFAYKDRDNYLQLFKDAGWEHVGSMGAWEYFRKLRQPGELLEIYSDKESNMRKYFRVMAFLGIISLPLWIAFTRDVPYSGLQGFYQAFRIFMMILALIYIYAIVRIYLRIQQLRQQ